MAIIRACGWARAHTHTQRVRDRVRERRKAVVDKWAGVPRSLEAAAADDTSQMEQRKSESCSKGGRASASTSK